MTGAGMTHAAIVKSTFLSCPKSLIGHPLRAKLASRLRGNDELSLAQHDGVCKEGICLYLF